MYIIDCNVSVLEGLMIKCLSFYNRQIVLIISLVLGHNLVQIIDLSTAQTAFSIPFLKFCDINFNS